MRLNAISYYADFALSAGLIISFAGLAISGGSVFALGEWIVAGVIGLVAWTIIEYVVHRWIYHRVPIFRDIHESHHSQPDAYIGAPPVIAVIAILALFFSPAVILGANAAGGLTCGVLVGYVGYMLVHHAAHHWHLSPDDWLYRLRRHHALHHHHSEEFNFGIITSFWDHVFGRAD